MILALISEGKWHDHITKIPVVGRGCVIRFWLLLGRRRPISDHNEGLKSSKPPYELLEQIQDVIEGIEPTNPY